MSELRSGYQQSDVGVIPDDWSSAKIADVGRLQTGPFGTVLKASEYSDDHGVPLISVGEIKLGKIVLRPDTPVVDTQVVRRLPRYLIREGDILFGRKGGVDRSAPVRRQQDGWFLGSDGIRLRPSLGYASQFLAYQFQTQRIQHWLLENSVGTTMPSMNEAVLSQVGFPIPSTEQEQKAIVEALGDADALIEGVEVLIAKKRSIKQGTMQDILTGDRRLPGFKKKWDNLRVSDFTSCTSGGTPSTKVSAFWGGNIPWMSSGELHLRNIWNVAAHITQYGLENSSAKIIPPNCLLIGLAGQGKTRGTVAINKIPLSTNQSIGAILPSSVFITEYLYHNFCARYEELREISSGDGGRGGLNLRILGAIVVPFPSLDEQRAIATVLSDMDAEIAALQDKLAKVRAVKQGMMQVLLTGEIRLI
jgi:type I restriction enzyme S subunit